MHLQHVQKNLVLSVRITNATVSWKCISIANLQRWHKGSHQLHQTEASDQRHPWLDTHLVPLVHGYKKKSAKTIPHTEVPTAEELSLFKSGCDFGQSQGLILILGKVKVWFWESRCLILDKVKVWCWWIQGWIGGIQGWIWAKSRCGFGKGKAEFGQSQGPILVNSRLNLVGCQIQCWIWGIQGWIW